MTKRKVSEKSKVQLREFLGIAEALAADTEEMNKEIASKNEKLLKFFESLDPWAEFYSLSHLELVACFFVQLGLAEKIVAITKAEDKNEANMALIRELMDQSEGNEIFKRLDALNKEKNTTFFSILMAMQGNTEGIRRYHETVSELVAKASHDHQAIFKAVSVDRSVVANPFIAREICQAELRQDESLMKDLAKSIAGPGPTRKRDLDDSRLMIEIMNEVFGLETTTQQEIVEILTNDLGIYPGGRQDPDAAIKKLIQNRNSIKRK